MLVLSCNTKRRGKLCFFVFTGASCKVDTLMTPITETKAFKLSEKPVALSACKTFASPEQAVAKKRARAKRKTTSKPSAPSSSALPERMEAVVVLDSGKTRAAWLVDDMMNCILFSIANVPSETLDEAAVETSLLQCLELAFNGRVPILLGKAGKEKEKVFTSWSSLRKHIKKVLATCHPDGGRAVSDDGDDDEARARQHE
jgi:hypothetical protein